MMSPTSVSRYMQTIDRYWSPSAALHELSYELPVLLWSTSCHAAHITNVLWEESKWSRTDSSRGDFDAKNVSMALQALLSHCKPVAERLFWAAAHPSTLWLHGLATMKTGFEAWRSSWRLELGKRVELGRMSLIGSDREPKCTPR